MKRIILALLVCTMLAGCGSGGGNTATDAAASPAIENTPGLYNLSYTPQSAPAGSGGGHVTVTGSVDAVDPYGDMGVMYVLNATDAVITGFNPGIANGVTRATITASFVVSTAVPGVFPFSIQMLKKTGMQLGRVPGSFVVY